MRADFAVSSQISYSFSNRLDIFAKETYPDSRRYFHALIGIGNICSIQRKKGGNAIVKPDERYSAGQYEELIENMLAGKVAVWKENAIVLLDASDILYFTILKKRVVVYTRSGTYESSSSLDGLERRLYARGFFRCHKSYIVNMDHVEKIVPWFNSTYMIKLKASKDQLPVSRHYTRKLRDLLQI